MEDNKEKYDPVEYAKKYSQRHYKRIPFAIPNDFVDKINEHLEITGEKRNAFIKRAIKRTIESDKRNEYKIISEEEE